MKKSGCSVQISFFVEMYRNPVRRKSMGTIGDQKQVVGRSGTQSNIELHQGLKEWHISFLLKI